MNCRCEHECPDLDNVAENLDQWRQIFSGGEREGKENCMGRMVKEGLEDDGAFYEKLRRLIDRLEGTANGDGYEEEKACGGSQIQKKKRKKK